MPRKISDATEFLLGLVGNLGIGITAPQGQLHLHDGVGGSMFTTVSAVGGTKVVIISTATGKPVGGVTCNFVLVSSAGAKQGGTFFVPVSLTHAVVAGAATWTFTLSAGGEFSVIRTSGSTETAIISMQLVWR